MIQNSNHKENYLDNNVKYLCRDLNWIDISPLESTIRDNASRIACRRITVFPKEFRFVSWVLFHWRSTRIANAIWIVYIDKWQAFCDLAKVSKIDKKMDFFVGKVRSPLFYWTNEVGSCVKSETMVLNLPQEWRKTNGFLQKAELA